MALPLPPPFAFRQRGPQGAAPQGPTLPRRQSTDPGFGQGAGGEPDRLGQVFSQVGEFFGLNPTTAPSPYQFDWTQMQGAQAGQEALLAQLQAAAAGEGPSIAQAMLQQTTDRNIRQAMALGQAQQGQGLGYGAALRSIADASAEARQASAGQAALLRAQEQQAAQQQQLALLGQIGGQALGQQELEAGTAGFYDQLAAQIAVQNAQVRRQFWGGLLGAAGEAGGALVGAGMADGGRVPGKARVRGDSKANDTQPRMLSPGEIVLPRSVTQAENAPEAAAQFVRQLQRRPTGPESQVDLAGTSLARALRMATREAQMRDPPVAPETAATVDPEGLVGGARLARALRMATREAQMPPVFTLRGRPVAPAVARVLFQQVAAGP